MHQAVTAEPVIVAADRLRAAYDGVPCAPVRDLFADGDVDAAYAVQDHNTRHWEAAGRRVVGYKIGLTSKVVQTQLGVDQPDFGVLFADMAALDGDVLSWGQVLQPRAEAEVAFVLGRDLDRPDATAAEVMAAIDHALPAIEIVGSRIADWNIRIVDTVADNGSSGAYVLGTTPQRIADVDLRLCGMVLWRRGEPVSVGAGAACLGHPLNAAAWLARKMAAAARPLRAGDVILSGALGPMVAALPGDRLCAEIAGLGSVRIGFGEAPA